MLSFQCGVLSLNFMRKYEKFTKKKILLRFSSLNTELTALCDIYSHMGLETCKTCSKLWNGHIVVKQHSPKNSCSGTMSSCIWRSSPTKWQRKLFFFDSALRQFFFDNFHVIIQILTQGNSCGLKIRKR